ncbi:hypothetical protein ON010_g17796 [Phytophthora cinnamomi]|nr:hypothetical protein ON010_g17796 [Phytophthora cinnamomi]
MSPFPSDGGEPSRKLPLLTRSEAGISIPSWHSSSEATFGATRGARNDPVPSMVGVDGNSDLSTMATDEGADLSGLSSSGSPLMSVTDYMVGTGAHMPMSSATVTRGSTTAIPRGSYPGMVISITSHPPRAGSASAGTETGTRRLENPAQIPLPGTPESRRLAHARRTGFGDQRVT